ncbi:tRNA (adenosine(37)-N6)-threonylcarbamoyltransferase complex ATPase subunit type 1 TsaE [Flavobacteriaceae bacterium]|jgi:tRNA threonylcarbamoyladenosine biosynthesis protein TsaE|nr:tRNA (adenosine(37)-N6)-threonylcarbamoyltransferase complex ATPase subunit type 1 TsaE [Flavobacteriaceae bacterium]
MKIEFDILDIDKVAETILDNVHSKIMLFKGSMGVGKTTLIKALVRRLGSLDVVSSPTFALMNEYLTKDCKIYHYDFYRLKELEEALDLGFDEFIEEDAWNMIEWPDLIVGLLPLSYVEIEIDKLTDTKRVLHLKKYN